MYLQHGNQVTVALLSGKQAHYPQPRYPTTRMHNLPPISPLPLPSLIASQATKMWEISVEVRN